MSFRCAVCRQVQPVRVSPVMVVTGRRERTYRQGDSQALGWEIVQQLKMCGSCAASYEPPVESKVTEGQSRINRPRLDMERWMT
jgi:hypothetical protein